MSRLERRVRNPLLIFLPLLLLLSACDRNGDDDHDHFLSVDRVEVYEYTSGDLLAYWQSGMSQFDANEMPTLQIDHELTLGVRFLDWQGDEPDLGDEYVLNAWIQSDDVEDAIELAVRADHVAITGIRLGTGYVVFDLVHGNHSDFTSVPLPIEVVAPPAPR